MTTTTATNKQATPYANSGVREGREPIGKVAFPLQCLCSNPTGKRLSVILPVLGCYDGPIPKWENVSLS